MTERSGRRPIAASDGLRARRSSFGGISIKSRIFLFQVVVCASVLMIAAFVHVTISQTNYYLNRVQLTNHQLEAITALSVNANRFSEQIAEYLLIGPPEAEDVESARVELEAGFDNLEEVTQDETDFIEDRTGQLDDQLDEAYRLERMRVLYAEINRAVADVFALRDQGRHEEAVLEFRREIENRLDAEFEALLIAARLDEMEEVHRTERRAEALWRQLDWITTVSSLGLVGLCVISGLLLTRSLMRPIRLLTSGTKAISRGELGHRIDHQSRDELGVLARRFNEMAAQQERQRGLLLHAQADLERQVADRTRELATANERLTELDRLRVQFLAEISHELRTPLTALRGEAEITLRHGSKPEMVYRDSLGRIVAQTVEMGRLVDDLLFLSRSETDTIRFEVRPTVLQEIISEALRDATALGQSKNLAIEAERPPDPVWIEADAQRFKQALIIVLDNAVKYSPVGQTILVRLTTEAGEALITVRNHGAGIPPEELPHVFERFYRGPVSSRGSRSGSGLGLAIAKELVEKHGGEIAVTSEAGRFTEVRIRVPQAKAGAFVEDSAR